MPMKRLRGSFFYFSPFSVQVAFIILIVTIPTFFDVYRITFFRTVSYDDYSRFLLYLIDNPHGVLPTSPSIYRIGSVALAVPFFYLPVIEFTDISGVLSENLPRDRIAATQAICMANVVYVAIAAFLASRFIVRTLGLDQLYGIILCFAFLSLSPYLSLQGVDGIAVFYFTLIILAFTSGRVAAAVILIVLSFVMNEKITIICFVLFASRLMFSCGPRRLVATAFAASIVALAAYLAMISLLPFPGNEYQREPSGYLSAFFEMVSLSLSVKGAYLIIWPVAILMVLWGFAVTFQPDRRIVYFSDIAVILGFTAITFALDVKFGVGRIVMHVYPLLVLGAVAGLSEMRKSLSTRQSGP